MQSYYPHDSNLRNKAEILPLRMKYGAEGYGVYHMILERLRDEKDYTSIRDYNMLAYDLRVDASLVKSVVEDFGLFAFTDDGKCFYSENLCERMEIKDEKLKKLSEAGKKGAAKRWNKEDDSHPIATPNKNDGNKSKVNKIKENEIKESTKPAPRKKREYPDSDPNMKLAKFLYKNILDHGIEIKKPSLQKWADTLRLLIERDERPGKQVQDTIKWIYQDAVDPFWRNTVQSAEGLRRNFDQITGKIKLEKEQPIGGHSHQKPAKQAETVPEWMQKKEYQPVDDESMETFNKAMKKLKGASG